MGTLFVVATPIGTLSDISKRALEILGKVDLIACEDTRETIKLLNHFGIQKPLTSYHEFNEEKKAEELAEKLKVPLSWVYEQSRQGGIPTHRVGRYIRFDLAEVLESQKKKDSTFP